MAKRKVKKSGSLIPESSKTEVVPKDLEDSVKALKALVTVMKLLNEVGYFPHTERVRLEQSLNFIGSLHQQTFELAQKHPQAFMIEGLLPNVKTEKQVEVASVQA